MNRLPLWPSSAERWTNCSGSAYIQAIAPRLKEEKPHAELGTYAQAVIAAAVNHDNQDVNSYLSPDLRNKKFDIDDEQQQAIDSSIELLKGFETLTGGEWLVEDEMFLEIGNHTFHMYLDYFMVLKDRIIIIDYKNGIQPVYADALQLLIYALTARDIYKIDNISVGILQPKMDIPLSFRDLKTEDLNRAQEFFENKVEQIYTNEPRYVPGAHCKWCPGRRGYCPEVLKQTIHASYTAKNKIDELPYELLEHKKDVESFLKELEKTAYIQLANGEKIDGWTLEEYTGRRSWIEKDGAADGLAELLGGDVDEYSTTTRKPIGITVAEKIAKKKGVDISALINKPIVKKLVKQEMEFDSVGDF